MVDVLGRDIEQARAMLEADGYEVEVVETRAPRASQPGGLTLTGAWRVVRQQASGRVVRLVVTHERYVPTG